MIQILDLIAGRCDAILADVGSTIDYMATDVGTMFLSLVLLSLEEFLAMVLVELLEKKILIF